MVPEHGKSSGGPQGDPVLAAAEHTSAPKMGASGCPQASPHPRARAAPHLTRAYPALPLCQPPPEESTWTHVSVPAGAPSGDPVLAASAGAHAHGEPGKAPAPPHESLVGRVAHKLHEVEQSIVTHVTEGVDVVRARAAALAHEKDEHGAPAAEPGLVGRVAHTIHDVEKSIVSHVTEGFDKLKKLAAGKAAAGAPAGAPAAAPGGEAEAQKPHA